MSGNPDQSSGSFIVGEIPVFQDNFEAQFVGGESFFLTGGYFEFFSDSQQTGAADNPIVENITIGIIDPLDGLEKTLFEFNETSPDAIEVNLFSNGNNADFALYVPVETILDNLKSNTSLSTLNGTDELQFSYIVNAASDTGGSEEFAIRDCNDPDVNTQDNFLRCFGDDQVTVFVPVPGGLPLLLSALAGLGWIGWRRRS